MLAILLLCVHANDHYFLVFVLLYTDLAGSIVQGSLCDLYRSDQCMTTADYYAIQCPSGARSTTTILSFFIILLLVAIAAQ